MQEDLHVFCFTHRIFLPVQGHMKEKEKQKDEEQICKYEQAVPAPLPKKWR